MSDRVLVDRYRVLAAGFFDDVDGKAQLASLGKNGREALELLIRVFGEDLALMPRDLDREHVRGVMTTYLPGRLGGQESYAASMPDLVDAFLRFVVFEEGLASSWELTSAVDECRAAYLAALGKADRPRFGQATKEKPNVRPAPKIGRNDPCFCGSGKKYKNCCLRLLG
jgi:hypothetical protein